MSSDYTGEEKVLIPGTLRGYRGFKTNLSAKRINGKVQPEINLKAQSYDYQWLPGINKAACAKYSGKIVHDSPSPQCTCGFYGTYESGSVPSSLDYVGVIEVHGSVVLGTRGFRAEKAKIVALSTSPEPSSHGSRFEILEYLGDRYEVDIFTSTHNLVSAYPHQDVSSLLPPPEPRMDPFLDFAKQVEAMKATMLYDLKWFTNPPNYPYTSSTATVSNGIMTVQTNNPDDRFKDVPPGFTEIIEEQSGTYRFFYPNGSSVILFPNGMMKAEPYARKNPFYGKWFD